VVCCTEGFEVVRRKGAEFQCVTFSFSFSFSFSTVFKRPTLTFLLLCRKRPPFTVSRWLRKRKAETSKIGAKYVSSWDPGLPVADRPAEKDEPPPCFKGWGWDPLYARELRIENCRCGSNKCMKKESKHFLGEVHGLN
jgi:hypothetical protein